MHCCCGMSCNFPTYSLILYMYMHTFICFISIYKKYKCISSVFRLYIFLRFIKFLACNLHCPVFVSVLTLIFSERLPKFQVQVSWNFQKGRISFGVSGQYNFRKKSRKWYLIIVSDHTDQKISGLTLFGALYIKLTQNFRKYKGCEQVQGRTENLGVKVARQKFHKHKTELSWYYMN